MAKDSSFEIPSFHCLLDSLPNRFQTAKVKEQLKRAYDVESKRINEYVQGLKDEGKEFSAILYLFRKGGGSQWVAEFEVNNLSIPRSNSYNWHLQNTSQWAYAGCILFDERSFNDNSEWIISTHH